MFKHVSAKILNQYYINPILTLNGTLIKFHKNANVDKNDF